MKTDRLIAIIMILLERQRVSIAELARMCEVSPRTISRDLETINLAGVPIVSYPGLYGGVGIMENFKLEKRLFTTADIATLLMGLGCIRSTLSGPEVVDALTKIRGFIPEEQRQEIERRAGRLSVDMTPWAGGGKSLEAIEPIQRALEENRLLAFDYTDRMGRATSRVVEPYRLLLKGMRWYLDGYCLAREDFRLFKLTRMEKVSVSDTVFVPRAYQPKAAVQPQFQDEGAVAVKLFVRDTARERFADCFGEDSGAEPCEGGFYASAVLPDGPLGYQMLLRFGTDCECLEPAAFRSGMRGYIHKLYRMYCGGEPAGRRPGPAGAENL